MAQRIYQNQKQHQQDRLSPSVLPKKYPGLLKSPKLVKKNVHNNLTAKKFESRATQTNICVSPRHQNNVTSDMSELWDNLANFQKTIEKSDAQNN